MSSIVLEAPPWSWEGILHSNILNVLLVLVGLGWIVKRLNIGQSLTKHQARVTQQVTEVEAEKLEMQQALKTLKQRSDTLHDEVNGILKEARQSADRITQQLQEQAEAEMERIRAQAHLQHEREIEQIRLQVQARFMQQVVADVRQTLINQTHDPDYAGRQECQVSRFIERLPEMHQPIFHILPPREN